MTAVKNSFAPKEIRINLEDIKEGELEESTKNETSPQNRGKGDHKTFSWLINERRREGVSGKKLNEIERYFECEFLKANVAIWGWAVIKSKASFYSGEMDAIAFRQCPSPQVLIVDWKSTDKQDGWKLDDWWDRPNDFRDPLYQCLVYRQLLAKHLKRELNGVDVEVGVMLVPYHQSHPETLLPGICLDFAEIEDTGLLEGLRKYRWVSDKSEVVHTIIPSESKLFQGKALKSSKYVKGGTKMLPEDTRLVEIINKRATIEDLREEFGLLELEVAEEEGKKEGERGGQQQREKKKKQKSSTKGCMAK